MDIVQDTLNLQSPFLTDAQINFDTLDNIALNQKLESIFYNLIYNNTDIKLIPKITSTKNLLILFHSYHLYNLYYYYNFFVYIFLRCL